MQIDRLQKSNQRLARLTQLISERKAFAELKRNGQVVEPGALDALEEALEDAEAERDTALRSIEAQCLTGNEEPFVPDTDGPFGGIPVGARKFLQPSSGLQD